MKMGVAEYYALHACRLTKLKFAFAAKQVGSKTGPSRWRQPVELSQLFAAIPPRDLAEILTASRTMIFTPKQTLFYTGEKD